MMTSDGTSPDSAGPTTDDPSGSESESESDTTDTAETDTTESDTTESDTTESDSETTTDPFCEAGTVICEDGVAKICDGMGGYTEETACDNQCADGLGCVLCVPGEGTCNGDTLTVCTDDGQGYEDELCDSVQGVMCDADLGKCIGACAPDTLGLSYIGCDYYPTVTANVVATNFNFAVIVSNTSSNTANVRVDQGSNSVYTGTVNAGQVAVIPLPWQTQLKASDAAGSMLVPDGAFRLRTDQPVTVYQYNPLEYQSGGFSYTNDASLLLPVNTWTGDYFVAARNSWLFTLGNIWYPGLYAVTASEDGTTVTIAPSATGGTIRAGGGLPANGAGQITLNQGDVLEVFSANVGGSPSPSDVTGTHITADKPIQVIGGSMCTYIPYNIQACDHIEESIPPYETLATTYIVTPPLIPTNPNQPKAEMVRIVATEANTTLTYDPPQGGAPTMIPAAGGYVEIAQNNQDFEISASAKVIVAQYMLGQEAGGNSGDPAMTLAVATEQFRDYYLFHAPTNYEYSYVNIVAPDGASVTLDGNAVNNFLSIGGTGYGVARLALANNGDGTHEISSDLAIGISVYGYGQYTSYWYPGGLDLELIVE